MCLCVIIIASRPDRPFNAAEENCFQALYASEYATTWDRVPKKTDGTCAWFLNHQKFLEWRDQPDSSLLWLSADPGCGKSVLSSFLCQHLSPPPFSESGKGKVIYFFFNADDAKQDSAVAALSAMIHQLIAQDHDLISHVINEYKTKKDNFLREFSTLKNIFTSIVMAWTDVNLIFVVDALDECTEDSTSSSRTELVEQLSKLVTIPRRQPIKIFMASRPLHTLQKRWANSRTILFDAGKVSSAIENDIERFIEARLSVLDLEDNIRDGVEACLITNADKTFLWASLVLRDMENSPSLTKKTLEQILDTIPKDLESLFEASLRQSRDEAATKKLLQILIFSKRPLSLTETDFAFHIKDSDASTTDVDREFRNIERMVRELCGSLVRVTSKHLYLVHQTASEYFRSEKPRARQHSWKRSIGAMESNLLLTKACMTYLMFSDFESEIPGGIMSIDPEYPYGLPRKFKEEIIDQYPFLNYAATYWFEHFRESEITPGEHAMNISYKLCMTESARFRNWRPASYKTGKLSTVNHQSNSDFFLRIGFGHDVAVADMLDNGSDANDTWAEKSALVYAIEVGYVKVVRVLAEMGADVNAQAPDCLSSFCNTEPIYMAIEHDHLEDEDRIEMLRILIEHGADVNSLYEEEKFDPEELDLAAELDWSDLADPEKERLEQTPYTALHGTEMFWTYDEYSPHYGRMNIEVGDRDSIRHYIEFYRKGTCRTPIMTAAEYGRADVVKLLLAHNADVNIRGIGHDTALHLAVKNGHGEVVKALLKKSDNANKRLAMVYAANPKTYGPATWDPTSPRIMRILLDSRLSPNQTDYAGVTPIMYHFSAGHVKYVQILLGTHPWPSYGFIKYWPRDDEIDVGKMMLGMRRDPVPWHYIQEVFKHEELHMALVHGRESNRRTALHFATSPEGVAYLLDKGASIESTDLDGRTALMFAARWDNTPVVQYLIQRGADIRSADYHGDTPLHHASERNNRETMEYLIGKGADKDVENKAGRTAVDNVNLYRPLMPGGTVYEAFQKVHAEYVRKGFYQPEFFNDRISPLKRSLNCEFKRRMSLSKSEWEAQVKEDQDNMGDHGLEILVQRFTIELGLTYRILSAEREDGS